MSKIPEGATHKITLIGGALGYRRKAPGGWEGYVDGDWVLLCGGMPFSYEPIQTEPEWSGEGLPPVGTVVDTDHENKEIRVKILAYGAHHGGSSCVLAADMSHGREGKMFGWMSDQCNFRPVRTQEQIAADEREKAIADMMQHGVDAGDATIEYSCAALYDAGYRKQVAK